ncbi:MAG: hypothetical protein WC799_16785 [Desulfobacteraceae bacterium]
MKIDKAILEKAAMCKFVDPITGLPPQDEISLSALLSIYHQQGRIGWNKVQLLMPYCTDSTTIASEVLKPSGSFSSEYPLFWRTNEELNARGGMRPDFIYISPDLRIVALIENKIGANDTHKDDSYGGQFGRYIKYLMESNIAEPYMILITSQFFLSKSPPWYATELQHAVNIQQSEGKIKTRIIVWEDILEAFS